MNGKNICKFVPEYESERIEVFQFIYETNQEMIKNVTRLNKHRLFLIKKGKGFFVAEDIKYSFNIGSLIIGFRGEDIVFVPDNECEYLYIDFSGARAETLFRRFGINKVSRVIDGFDGLLPLWQDSLYKASEANLDLVSESILLYTFSRLSMNSDERNEIINSIIEITEKRFNDSELSVSVIADVLSYNAKYISHIFKEKMGVRYSEYLKTMRIKYAITLLEHGIDSVKNVALLSGFSDPLYFSTVFKKTVGVSPKEYKKTGHDLSHND